MTFPLARFRLLFPAFPKAKYPDTKVELFAEEATAIVTIGSCKSSERIWMLLTAHLLTLSDGAQSGSPMGPVASAKVGDVSVAFAQSQRQGNMSLWLSTTPYGLEASALLSACVAGGMYIGGSPERAAFTKVGGRR